ncbi:MAG TPA: YceI family protein [Streptosporangiaceae bacterium]|nr:YceI family protein [Streptosporangiaceae bacterium]
MRAGSYKLGPATGRLLVKTGRTGLGRRAGHDLTIEVTQWEATATIDPADPGASSVTVTADVDSFAIREGAGGVKPLTDGDRAEIKRTLQREILRTDRHPSITFQSTRVTGTAEEFAIEGELTILDRTRPVTVRGSVESGDRIRGGTTIVQSQFGIKPYSAFFGALKLADEVEIAFDLGVPSPA